MDMAHLYLYTVLSLKFTCETLCHQVNPLNLPALRCEWFWIKPLIHKYNFKLIIAPDEWIFFLLLLLLLYVMCVLLLVFMVNSKEYILHTMALTQSIVHKVDAGGKLLKNQRTRVWHVTQVVSGCSCVKWLLINYVYV